MKNATILQALEIGFDFENSTFEDKEELQKEIIEFLNENVELLPRTEDECEVNGNSNKQFVNHGDYSSSGEILQYGPDYWYLESGSKIFHSNYLLIDGDGKCYNMNLYQVVTENEYNTPKVEGYEISSDPHGTFFESREEAENYIEENNNGRDVNMKSEDIYRTNKAL